MHRFALILPLAFALGCGGSAPPPAAATETGSAPAAASPAAAGAAPAAAAAAAAPAAAPAAADKAPGDAAGSVGKATATDAPINTKISQDDVLALVNKNADAFFACYTLGAGSKKKDYKAKVTIKATVSPTGAVNAVEVLTSTTKNAKVDACVSDAFKKLTFNRPAGSGATVFTFPLSFDGMAQTQ